MAPALEHVKVVRYSSNMSRFEENVKELIILSEAIRKHAFRSSFITHFTEKVKELGSYSSKVDVRILQRLQLKLLEPLMLHLRTGTNSDDKCVLIRGLIQVLKLTLISSVNALFDVYTTVFFQIFKDRDLPYQPSEELKECVLDCCTYLLKNATEDVTEKIYSQESGPKLSLGVSISVNIVKEERSIKLRIVALDFLLAASKFDGQCSKELFTKVGDLFMLYLPGILGPLLEVIMRDETQHHLITVKALSCWGHVLCVVMKDPIHTESPSDIEVMMQWLTTKSKSEEAIVDVSKGLKEKERSSLWLESAAHTLHPLLVKLSDVRKHSHPKCRLELTLVMAKLLRNCIKNLKTSLPVIVEVLVSSAMDADAEVREVAEKALSEFEAECDERSVGLFVSVLEENLYSIIKQLPRTVQAGNEQLLLPSLKSFSGYLRILGRLNRLQHLVSVSSTLKKLVSVLKVCFELETYPEISNQDFSIWENETKSEVWHKPWKRFRHFADRSVQIQLEEICHDLGKFADSETLFDFLVDTYHEDTSRRKETLLILSEVISGSTAAADHVVSQLVEFFLEPENLNLPLQVNGVSCNSLREAQTNIIRVGLLMEGVGHLAKSQGKRFENHLFKTLYYVLERMGSSYSVIRESAKKCAVEMANACELEGGVTSLIQKNVDYLTYHVTMKLRRNDESVFEVVTVLMRNSPFDAMPDLEEVINRVLKSSSQNVDSPHTLSYLRLFQTFVLCVNKWMKTDTKAPQTTTPPQESMVDRLLKTFEAAREEPEEEGEPEETEEEPQDAPETADPPEEPEKPQLPRHLKLTLAVANHCLHYLPSRDNAKKIMVLEILNQCVWALSEWENDLLPLVHQIWSPLVTRFELVTDPLIINRSFELLCTLSFTSKDFIRARTLKEVLPALEAFLTRQAAKSKLKSSASDYFFTQNFKLQRELLSNLGKLTSSLGLFEKQTDLVAESALPYLSSQQPRELQDKCKLLFEDLKAHDPYLVYLKISPLAGNPEFAKNARTVLDSIQ